MRVDDVPGRLLARVREARGVAARPRGDDATRSADARDLLDAEKTLGENAERARRVLGPRHSIVTQMLSDLALLRKILPKIHAALGASAGEART